MIDLPWARMPYEPVLELLPDVTWAPDRELGLTAASTTAALMVYMALNFTATVYPGRGEALVTICIRPFVLLFIVL